MSNLNTIERYIKNINNIELNNISFLHLFQLKSYLKIIDISYLINIICKSILLEITSPQWY